MSLHLMSARGQHSLEKSRRQDLHLHWTRSELVASALGYAGENVGKSAGGWSGCAWWKQPDQPPEKAIGIATPSRIWADNPPIQSRMLYLIELRS